MITNIVNDEKANAYVDNSAQLLEAKAAVARSQGNKVLAKFYYEAALRAFDCLTVSGDPKYKQQIQKSLSVLEAEMKLDQANPTSNSRTP